MSQDPSAAPVPGTPVGCHPTIADRGQLIWQPQAGSSSFDMDNLFDDKKYTLSPGLANFLSQYGSYCGCYAPVTPPFCYAASLYAVVRVSGKNRHSTIPVTCLADWQGRCQVSPPWMTRGAAPPRVRLWLSGVGDTAEPCCAISIAPRHPRTGSTCQTDRDTVWYGNRLD